jgi:hypothetical protein
MKTASWVILTVVGALILLGSTVSLWVGYSGTDYPIGTKPLSEIEAAHPGVGAAMRGIRGTSAAYGVAYGILFLAIVLGPYRRREVWAWWAILGSAAALALYAWLRVPMLGIKLGVTTAFLELGVIVVGLLLDAGRLRAAR